MHNSLKNTFCSNRSSEMPDDLASRLTIISYKDPRDALFKVLEG